MKVFVASIDHETNRFSPVPTSIESYRDGFLYRPATGEGADKLKHVQQGSGIFAQCKERGHEVVVGLIAATHPSAPTLKKDYELLRDELLDCLKMAMPVDCIVLRLHGAMVAEGYDDCEGDILRRIRGIAGTDVPLGVIFDLHGNVSRTMVDNADMLIACKEYPHTDFDARTEELLSLLERMVAGECQPTTCFQQIPMTGLFQTTREPMRGLVDEMLQLEDDSRVLSISLTHGFFWADVADVASGVLVVTDGDSQLAADLAGQLAEKFFSIRGDIQMPLSSLDEALRMVENCETGPVVLADRADNPGGGAAGDSTFILRRLLELGMTDVAIGMIWDPMAVDMAMKAGVGVEIPLRIGGKMGPMSGDPVDLDVTVIARTDNLWQWAMGARDMLGPAVAVEAEGIQLILASTRQQVLSPECFTELTIDLARKKLVVVKSAQHFSATFSSIASEILYVGMQGTVDQNYSKIPAHAIVRPLWPMDEPPFTAFGREWCR